MAKRNAAASTPDVDEIEDVPTVDLGADDGDEDGGWMTHQDDSSDLWDGDDSNATPIPEPLSEQLKKPVGQVLSAIALQGVSTHAKKRPISALDAAWLRTTWERITGLLSDQPEADEAAEWKRDVQLLECEADLRDVDLFTPAEETDTEASRVVHVDDGDYGPDAVIDAAVERADTIAVVMSLPITDLAPDPEQARDEGADDELADSIEANGFYPSKAIEVREHPYAGELIPNASAKPISYPAYMIVDGERRYRGAVKAGLTHVPVIVTGAAADEGERLLRQVVMNEGKRLKPMEEARTFKRIMDAKDWTIQQLATHLGKSKSTVSDRVAMADAPGPFAKFFEQGTITAAAAPIIRPLSSLPQGTLERMAERIGRDYDWKHAVDEGRAIDLDEFRNLIQDIVDTELRPLTAEVSPFYKGKAATIGKVVYAIDAAAYDAAERTARKSEKKADGSHDDAAKRRAAEAQSARKRQEQQKAEQEKQAAAEAAFKKVLPAALDAIAAKVKGMPAGVDSPLAVVLRNEMRNKRDPSKYVPRGRSAEDLVRSLAFSSILSESAYYGAWRSFPYVAKKFGVDIGRLLKEQSPAPSKKGKKATPAKKSAKKSR